MGRTIFVPSPACAGHPLRRSRVHVGITRTTRLVVIRGAPGLNCSAIAQAATGGTGRASGEIGPLWLAENPGVKLERDGGNRGAARRARSEADFVSHLIRSRSQVIVQGDRGLAPLGRECENRLSGAVSDGHGHVHGNGGIAFVRRQGEMNEPRLSQVQGSGVCLVGLTQRVASDGWRRGGSLCSESDAEVVIRRGLLAARWLLSCLDVICRTGYDRCQLNNVGQTVVGKHLIGLRIAVLVINVQAGSTVAAT